MTSLIPDISVFVLMLARISAFFVTMPIFSYRTLPAQHRIAFSFLLTWMMVYTVDVQPFVIDGAYILLVIKEVMVGLLLGFVAYMIISAVQVAGGFIDFQMGFAIANVIDPQTGVQSPLIGQYLYTFALLLLLSLNGHHLILDGIFYSYQFIPLDSAMIQFAQEPLVEMVIKSFNAVFIIALQLSMPVVATLFLVDVALGIVARTVPQFNIFVVGFPIKIAVSFIVLVISMTIMMVVIQDLFHYMFQTMRGVMDWLGAER